MFYSGPQTPLGGVYIFPWVTDGTEAGTHLLVNTGGDALMTIPLFFWDFRGLTMFQAMDGDGHINLWRSDGTSAGTANLGAVGVTAPNSLYPVTHKTAGQTFFYVADDGNDRLKGGAGTNVLLGGAGDDLLIGGKARNLLIGGAGADRIIGNSGQRSCATAIECASADSCPASSASGTSHPKKRDRLRNISTIRSRRRAVHRRGTPYL